MKSKLYILLCLSLISFFHSYGQERVDEKRPKLQISMDAQSEKLANISGWSRIENKEGKFWEQSDQTSNRSYLPCCPDAGFESLQLFKFTLEGKIFYFLNVKYDSTRMRVFAFTNNSLEQLKKIINAADGQSYKALPIEDCEYYTKVFEVPFSFDPEEVIKNKEMIKLLLLGEGSDSTSNSCKGESFFNINSQVLKGEKIVRFNIVPLHIRKKLVKVFDPDNKYRINPREEWDWVNNDLSGDTTLPITNNYFELKKNDFDKLFSLSPYVAIVIPLNNEDNEEKPLLVVEQNPEFSGGYEAMLKFLKDKMQYPTLAQESGIQGTVFVQFVVSKTGQLSNVKILRGIGGGCDEEAVRVVKEMPNWVPGRQNGQDVPVMLQIPINFQLNRN